MIRIPAVFRQDFGPTPAMAAKLSNCAEQYSCEIALETQGKQVRMDSLISLISMSFVKEQTIYVVADGPLEDEAAQSIRTLLEENA